MALSDMLTPRSCPRLNWEGILKCILSETVLPFVSLHLLPIRLDDIKSSLVRVLEEKAVMRLLMMLFDEIRIRLLLRHLPLGLACGRTSPSQTANR